MFNSQYGPYYGGHSSYIPDRQYYDPYQARAGALQAAARARQQAAREREAALRVRALAEQKARRAQWLPSDDEGENSDEEWEYNQLDPMERLYLDARKRQRQLERHQQEQEAIQRGMEEQNWQRQLEEKQEEEDERRRQLLEERKKTQQESREKARVQAEAEAEAARARQEPKRRSTSARPGSHQIPINDSESPAVSGPQIPTPAPSRTPSPQPRTTKPAPDRPTPERQYDESHEEAASRIQSAYRVHTSFRSIKDIENNFKDLKNGFTFPTTIDFQQPSSENGHVSVQVHRPPPAEKDTSGPMDVDGESPAKLAYTSTNYALHLYVEQLSKLLIKLDGVESWGNVDVRKRRRSVVMAIEDELTRIEGYWKGAWSDYVQSAEGAVERQDPEAAE